MPSHGRPAGGDSLAAGRARLKLKLAAVGYSNARHGVDADEDLARAGVALLCKTAIEFVEALPGSLPRNCRVDLYRQGDSEMLRLVAIAYANARHGIDADVGMARDGLALLCQAAIDYVESLPKEDPTKRPAPHLQLGNGAR